MNANTTEFVSEKQLATRLGIARGTLRKWRHYGRGPTFVRMGGSIRYAESAIRTWLAQNEKNPGAAA